MQQQPGTPNCPTAAPLAKMMSVVAADAALAAASRQATSADRATTVAVAIIETVGGSRVVRGWWWAPPWQRGRQNYLLPYGLMGYVPLFHCLPRQVLPHVPLQSCCWGVDDVVRCLAQHNFSEEANFQPLLRFQLPAQHLECWGLGLGGIVHGAPPSVHVHATSSHPTLPEQTTAGTCLLSCLLAGCRLLVCAKDGDDGPQLVGVGAGGFGLAQRQEWPFRPSNKA